MKMPQGWDVKASVKTHTKIEGKINMGAEVVGHGLCPECRQPLQEAVAGEHKVWACAKDRIALPMPNEGPNENAVS